MSEDKGMPEKSIREMNKLQRRHYSLAARTFRAAIAGAVILGVVALLIGFGLYAFALGSQYIGKAYDLTRSAASIINKVTDPEPLCSEVMARYNALTEEQKKNAEKDAPPSFADITEREDYKLISGILLDFLNSSDIYDIYLAMYVEDGYRLVYILDPAEGDEDYCHPGEWDSVPKKETERFLNSDGERRTYYIDKTENDGWLGTSGVPLYRENGEIYAFILADVSMQNVINGMKSFLLQYTLSMFVLVNAVAVLMALHMKKKLVDPVNRIAEAAGEYIKNKKDGNNPTDTFKNLSIRTGDEIENLALTMADMENDLADYEKNLAEITKEKERVGAELALAQRIQADMLPNVFPAFPERKDFDIYASMTPAKEVGGDFYDFFLTDEDHLCIVIADVSGKGVPAALFMMMTMIMIQNNAMSGKSPGEVLRSVNDQICSNNREEMFVTVWLGKLDLRTGVLVWANAGHEYPVFKDAYGSFEFDRSRHGIVIGAFPDRHYEEFEKTLSSGSKLFVYTDGVPEAKREDGDMFELHRILKALVGSEDGTPKEIVGSVASAINEFVSNDPQFDDITMLCVHYIGEKEDEKMKNVKEITVDATIANIDTVTDFINAELENLDCPPKAEMQIDVAIDELFGNIAKYAYDQKTGSATVQIEVEDDPTAVVITFIDSGRPFDPLNEVEEPDITLSAEDRKIGGLGVFLVKKTMDGVSYEYKDGKNILKIRKNI